MIVDYLGYPRYGKITPIECLQAWKNYGHEKRLKLQDYDELNLMCINLSPRGSGYGGSG